MTENKNHEQSILVVDDTQENLELLTGMLKTRGYVVRPAPSGKIALMTARVNPPDLVLLDINMPEMDGYEVCRQFKADPALKDIPVIFLTAFTETSEKIKAFGVGGVDYITKPFESLEVEARIKAQLTIREQERLLRESAETQLRALVQAMNDTILVFDKNGAFSRIDAQRPGKIYREGDNFEGENLNQAYDAGIASLLIKNVQRSLKSQKTINIEYSIAHDDGEMWFNAAISPITQDLALCVARDITELKLTQGKLEAKTVRLEEINTTLNILIDKMKESTKNLEETMFSNIRTFVLPHVENLKKMRLNDVQIAYVDLIESNLSKLASPLIHDMRQFNLTPMEIQVANLIKDGRTTKDIASLLHTSKVAIDNHRYNIRKKLGINNKKENLRSFFLSIT
jgi:DNA-binding response OmpR family regulator/DNA-binding CsgD family transcriptional regulator